MYLKSPGIIFEGPVTIYDEEDLTMNMHSCCRFLSS